MAKSDNHSAEPPRPAPGTKVEKAYNSLSIASVGLEMGVSVAVGLAIGYFLDKEFGTDPYLTLVFLLLGVAAGFKALLRAARQAKATSGESKQ